MRSVQNRVMPCAYLHLFMAITRGPAYIQRSILGSPIPAYGSPGSGLHLAPWSMGLPEG